MRYKHLKTMVAYVESSIDFFGYCILTHKDILKKTNANCSYSVIRSLKRRYNVEYEDIRDVESPYRKYTLTRKEEGDNAKKTHIRGICENV